MSLRNTERNWGSLAKLFHWLIVAMVIVEVPVGFLMAWTYGPSFSTPAAQNVHWLLEQIHHTNGFALLAVVVMRLCWRFFNPTPHNTPAKGLLNRAAVTTHALLYALLIFLPLSGWAALSVLGNTKEYGAVPIWFFNQDRLIPPLLPQRPLADTYGYGFFAKIHVWLLWCGLALLSVHVGAALWHHFFRKDRVLRAMWPLAGDDRKGNAE